ncbi:response regulator transcription factor [Pedobacter jamesrossensis]|uniref:Response regulator transcription factor n=1 Tax=Pedobacter jamesrossensis TaxID=1908238 RepID=A0ABV8NR50_9SPHI
MSKRILIVDDNLLFLKALNLLLSQEGFTVQCSENAKSIDSIISGFKPDLIILDIKLEDEDGRIICNDIKERPHTNHIPIIIITALSFDEISEMECEADAILGKPYETANLLLTINQLLQQTS